MPYRLDLPKGGYVIVDDDISREEALEKAAKDFPDRFPGVGEQLLGAPKEIAKGVGLGVVQTLSGLASLPYSGARALFPSLTPYEETSVGKSVASAEESLAPGYGTISELSGGLGQFGSMFGPQALLRGVGGAGRLATGIAPRAAAPVGIAQAGGAGSEQARLMALEAKQEGVEVSPGEEFAAQLGGFGIGQLELLPVEKLLRGLPANLDEPFKYNVSNLLKRATTQGGVEGAQEVASNLLQEFSAKGIYNPDLEVGESMFDEFTMGAGVGSIAQLGLDVLLRKDIKNRYAQSELKKKNEEVQRKTEELLKQERDQIQKTKDQLGIEEPVDPETGKPILALPAPAAPMVKTEGPDPILNPLGFFSADDLRPEAVNEINKVRTSLGQAKLTQFSIEDIVDALADVGATNKVAQAEVDRLITGKLAEKGIEVDLETQISSQDIENIAQAKGMDTSSVGFKDFLRRTTGTDNTSKMSLPQKLAAVNAIQAAPEGLGVLPQATNATRFTKQQYRKAVDSLKKTFPDEGRLGRSQVIKEIKEYTGLENDRDAESLLNTAIRNDDFTTIQTPFYEVLDPDGVVRRYNTRKSADEAATRVNGTVKETTSVDIGLPGDLRELPGGPDIRKGVYEAGEAPDRFDITSNGQIFASAKTQEEADAKAKRLQEIRDRKAAELEGAIASIQGQIEKANAKLEEMEASGQSNTIEYAKASAGINANNQKLKAKLESLNNQVTNFRTPLEVKAGPSKKVGREGFTLFQDGNSLGTFPSRQDAEEAAIRSYDLPMLERIAKYGDEQRGLMPKRLAAMARKEIERRASGKPGIEVPISKETSKGKTEEEAKAAATQKLEDAGVYTEALRDKIADLEKRLLPMLQKMGLKDVGLRVMAAIKAGGETADGAYANKLIEISLSAADPIGTLRHEAIHALKELGFFKPNEWKILEKAAKDRWINQYLKSRKAEDGRTLFDSYVDMYGGDMDTVIEEAIAEAFRFAGQQKAPEGILNALVKKMGNFFEALGNAFQGLGFKSAKDVFSDIEMGRLKQISKQESKADKESKKYRILADEPEVSKSKNVVFEVAPDPNNEELSGSWNKLNNDRKLEVSRNIGEVISKDALKLFDVDSKLVDQIGSYENDTNPSFAVDVKDGDPVEIAKVLGFALSQDSMMVISGTPGKGLEQVPVISIKVGDVKIDSINRIYQKLRTIEVNGVKPIGGQSTIDGYMNILNYSNVDNDELAVLVDQALLGLYDVSKGKVYSAFPSKKEYDYASERDDAGGGEAEVRARARTLRSEANRLLNEEISGAKPRPDESTVRSSDSSGIVLSGQLQPDAISLNAIHYAREANIPVLAKNFYGRGIKGAEASRVFQSRDPRIRNRVYFYVPLSNGRFPNPEVGLGKNVYSQRFRNILGPGKKIGELFSEADGDANKFESLVIDAGYDGYAPYDMGMVVILNHDVPVNYQGFDVKPEKITKFSIRALPSALDIVKKPDTEYIDKKKVTVDDVGNFFDDQILKEFGAPLDYNNPEHLQRAINIAKKEVGFQLKQEKSGLDWYEEDIKSSFEDTAKVIPELKDENKRQLFSVIAGIMSPGVNARDNWFIAAKAFQHYVNTGTVPDINPENDQMWQGGPMASGTKTKQLRFLNNMIQTLGEAEALNFMMSFQTVSEINRMRKDLGGMVSGVSGKKNDLVPGLYAFGPKVGPFVSNINGIHDVTVDKWMTRTFNRYFGTMIATAGQKAGTIVETPTEPQRRAVKDLINEVARDAGIKNYQVQSLLWFFEQRLFRSLGTPSPSYAFSDGARKFLDSSRGAAGGIASDRAAKRKSEKKLAIALGRIEPETRLTATTAPDPDGILAFSPERSPLRGNPIVLKVGTHNEVEVRDGDVFDSDKGFGAIHILTRIIENPSRRPVGGEELLEQIVLDAQKIAENFNVIYPGNKGHLVLYNTRTKDSLVVKPQKNEVSIVTMFKQDVVNKLGSPVWFGKNVQPVREAFVAKISGAEVIANGRDIILKPIDIRKKRVITPLNVAELASDMALSKPGTLSLKKKASIRAVDTPEFKRWFGDSKIVDADGNPKIMYHGTARDITEFRPKQASAIFVTDNPRFAEGFSGASEKYMADELFESMTDAEKAKIQKQANKIAKKEGTDSADELMTLLRNRLPSRENIMPLYVRAENPFDYDNPKHIEQVLANYPKKYRMPDGSINPDDVVQFRNGSWDVIEDSEVQKVIRSLGFDSFYVKEGGVKNLAVYDPNQIKSATGNEGTFRRDTGDIRYSLRSKTPPPKDIQRFFDQAERLETTQEIKELRDAWIGGVSDSGLNDAAYYLNEVPGGKDYTKNVQKLARQTLGDRIKGFRLMSTEELENIEAGDLDYYAAFTLNPNTAFNFANFVKNREISPKDLVIVEADINPGDIHMIGKDAESEIVVNMYKLGNQKVQEFAKPVRYSLRDSIPQDTLDSIDRTTTKRQEEGFVQRIVGSFSPIGFAKFRQNFINRYEGIEKQSRNIADQFGDAELLADTSAIAAALMSDRASGVAAESFRNGVPVYNKGYTYVDNLNGQVKGLIPIFEPLMKFNDPYVFQAFQFYAGTKRGKRLTAEGREKLFTNENQDIKKGELLGEQYPIFKQVFQDYQRFNEQIVKYMVDTGVISKEMGAVWMQNSDYIPFYRQMEGERTAGPNIFSSFSSVMKPKKLKGGEGKLADFLETVVRNTRSAIEAGMKNVAQQRVIRDAVRLGTASRLPVGARMGPDVATVRVNGKDEYFIVDDPLLMESIKGLNIPKLPFLDILAAPSRFLRELVTRDPGFMVANLFRDSVSSWVTTGTNIVPIADTFKQYGKVLSGLSPEATALARAGIGTGYEFAGDVQASTEAFTKELRDKAGEKTLSEKALMPLSAMWKALEKGSTASDLATRSEVYKRVLQETGSEAEAIYQAMEVINFSRMGSSPIIQIASALIPFFNARVQGLDVLYRSGFGRSASARRDRQQRAFITRSMTILALSSLYWMLASDQEEWERAEPEQRDNNWIIGSVRLPIPFEIGTVFKVFPERILEYFFGDDTSKDLKDSFVRNLTSTMAFNPIPQAVLPIIENVANYSFFTGQPIVGKGMEDVADPFQINTSTSLFAQRLGEASGQSPIKIDNLVRGYTGTIGTYGVMLIDSIMRGEGDPTKASLSPEQIPVLKRFFASEQATGTISAYYDMKRRVDEVTRTVNALERTGDYENLIEYQKENGKLLAIKPYIQALNKDMADLRDSKRQILISKMDPDLKNNALENIRKAEIALTSRIQYLKKIVD